MIESESKLYGRRDCMNVSNCEATELIWLRSLLTTLLLHPDFMCKIFHRIRLNRSILLFQGGSRRHSALNLVHQELPSSLEKREVHYMSGIINPLLWIFGQKAFGFSRIKSADLLLIWYLKTQQLSLYGNYFLAISILVS